MIKNIIFLVLVTVTVHNEARTFRTNEDHELVQEKWNRQELARIVRVLNGNDDTEKRSQNDLAGNRYYINPKKLVKVLETKYANRFSNTGPTIRFHYIKNPQVLEEFVKNLRKDSIKFPAGLPLYANRTQNLRRDQALYVEARSISSSSESSDDNSDGGALRRYDVFRVRGAQVNRKNSEEIQNDSLDDTPLKLHKSLESQITPFKPHLVGSNERKNKEIEIKPKHFTPTSKKLKLKPKADPNEKSKLEFWSVAVIKETTRDTKSALQRKKEDDQDSSTRRYRESNEEGDKWNVPLKSKKTPKDGEITNNKPKRLRKRPVVKERKGRIELGGSLEENKKRRPKKFDIPVKEKDVPKPRKVTQPWENKNTEADYDWDKVGRDWGKGSDENRPRVAKRYKKQRNFEDDEPYKPIGSYTARDSERHRPVARGSFFPGRTPIPFVGKRIVYDDSK